jgi:alcohol oxidase
LKKQVWAYKKQREIMRRMQMYRGEVKSWHPPFAVDSAAACVELEAPLADDVADIKYTPADDAVIEKFLRERIGTTWHSLGTCKMAPREEKGVVDANLGVYGVAGLKIADLSIPPGNVAANTNSTALAVGEKAADIFIRELGLEVS